MKQCRYILVLLLGSVASSAAWSQESDFFEKRVRPILAEHCYSCHGSEKQENDLRLDRAKDLFSGGVSGNIISPGKPESSLLIAAVLHTNEDLQMPPEKKLSARQIADLTRWVKLGAVHPELSSNDLASAPRPGWSDRLAHWSFQPLTQPNIPTVQDTNWLQTPIDNFVLRKLEETEVTPAPTTSRRSLIRRATFDLIGLPPTPAEVSAFERDPSPHAFEKVVDRLLASPHYGERWGRHWLDVVRYADSNGLDENVAHANAWRYRDWVIQAFNNDMGYDKFVRFQLAGDLLTAESPEERNKQLIATGFLSLGPKVLAEVDETKMEMDIVDEQISTVSTALLGLTIGCARCHDHKFDPVSQADYYALAGVFQSTHTMDSFTKIAKWHEHELHDRQFELARTKHSALLNDKTALLETEFVKAKDELSEQSLPPDDATREQVEKLFPPETQKRLVQIRSEIESLKKNPPTPPTAMGVLEGEPVETAIHIRGSHLTLGEKQPRNVPTFLRTEEVQAFDSDTSGRLQLANSLMRSNHPLTARVMVNRIWRWHFGKGLVATTDNLGLLGQTPSHPALLDHLASSFAKDWSIKNLHRQIMLSATYQTAAGATPLDDENRLLSHWSVRRLEAEEIRDAMLSVSGLLERSPGGPAIATANRKHVFDHTSKDDTEYSNFRRSIYLPVVRNHLHESFTLFDYTDASVPNGSRNTSTVASQALYLLNSEFTENVSQKLANRVLSESSDDETAIHRLYQLVFSRNPSTTEMKTAIRFLNRAEEDSTRETAWRLLCHTILISNEFFYVR